MCMGAQKLKNTLSAQILSDDGALTVRIYLNSQQVETLDCAVLLLESAEIRTFLCGRGT